MTRSGGLGAVAALLLTAVLAIALLYAYRSQTPAVPTVPYTAAQVAIDSGRLRSVVIEDGRAHLTFVDGTRQDAVLPDDGQPLARAITDHNRADPAHPVDVIFGAGSTSVALPYFLIPLLLLAVLVVLTAWAFARGRVQDRYVALSRVADLRERGVLSEEELQREKRRILG